MSLSREHASGAKVRRKALFTAVVACMGIAVVTGTLWLLAEGIAVSMPARRVAVFLALASAGMSVVALVSLAVLLMTHRARERLGNRPRRADKGPIRRTRVA
jgi:hypothetical protein